jgi:hypothetical protein
MNLHESDVSDRGKQAKERVGFSAPDVADENMPLAAANPSKMESSQHQNALDSGMETSVGQARKELEDNPLSYDEQRLRMKFGYWQSSVIIFQSTVGISWFTLHQPLMKVGIYLGAIITILSGYITTYGLLLLDETAALAERDQERSIRIKNVEELCGQVRHKLMPTVKWTMMIASLAMIFASSISNLCLMADTIEHYFHIPQWQTKLITFLVISIFLIFIVEPEGIESVTYITTIMLTFLGRYSFNRNHVLGQKHQSHDARAHGQVLRHPEVRLEIYRRIYRKYRLCF